MNKNTKTIIRVISAVLVVLVMLMNLGVIPNVIVVSYHFWVMVIAYFMLVLTLRV